VADSAAPLTPDLSQESERDLMVRAAWLYYVCANNQESTARLLGLTRARVNRLLAGARDSGLVSISIEHSLTAMLEIERTLATVYGLDFCLATPPLGRMNRLADTAEGRRAQAALARRAVAVAGARFLASRLGGDKPVTVGVGWGRTLEQLTMHLSGVADPRARFVALMGSLTRNSASNPFEVVHTLAARTGGQGFFLPVPFIADSEADREVLAAQRTVREVMEVAAEADFLLVSLGELTRSSFLHDQGLISADDLADLRTAGAVGDSIGLFFDAAGRVVDHPVARRTLAVDLAVLRDRPLVLLAAGVEKEAATLALLEGGIVDALIVDGDLAGRLTARLHDRARDARRRRAG